MPVSGGGAGGSYTPLAGGTSLYVDSATGSDTTGDGTAGSPIATLDRALQDVRYRRATEGSSDLVTINLVDPGDGVYGVDPATVYSPEDLSGAGLTIVQGSKSLLIAYDQTGGAVTGCVFADSWATYDGRQCWEVTLGAAPGWVAGDLEDGWMLKNVATGKVYPVVGATDTTKVLVGAGFNGTAAAAPISAGQDWEIGKYRTQVDLSNANPGKWLQIPNSDELTFRYVHAHRASNPTRPVSVHGGFLSWKECILDDISLGTIYGARQQLNGCVWVIPNGGWWSMNGGSWEIAGSVVTSNPTPAVFRVQDAVSLVLRGPNVFREIAADMEILGELTLVCGSLTLGDVGGLALDDVAPFSLNGSIHCVPAVEINSRLPAGETEQVPTGIGSNFYPSADSEWVQSDGTTPATVPLSEAVAPWAPELLEVPNDTVYQETLLPTGVRFAVADVYVQVPTLGSTAGTYTFDVLLGGTSVLSSTVDLTGVTAGVWTAAALKTNGDHLHDGSSAQTLRVEATSDNADLTGYTDGILVSITLRRW